MQQCERNWESDNFKKEDFSVWLWLYLIFKHTYAVFSVTEIILENTEKQWLVNNSWEIDVLTKCWYIHLKYKNMAFKGTIR